MNEIIICFLLFASVFNLSEDPEKVIAKTNNEFSFKIFRMLSKNANDVMSSLSILSAFSILMNGAKGETLLDMKSFLEFKNHLSDSSDQSINEGFQKITERYQNRVDNNQNKGNVFLDWEQQKHQLNMANLVSYNKQLQLIPEFKNTVKQYFKGEVQSADFQNNAIEETNKINDWVRNKTNNKIQKVFDQLKKSTNFVIVNVLYFKGIWEKTFSNYLTKGLDFYNDGVTPVKTDTMNRKEYFMYSESSELDSQVLEMDYIGGEISFVIILPKNRNSLNSLKNNINAQVFDRALKSMPKSYVDVYLPKFKVEKSYQLMEVINPKPIALTNRADLTRLTSGKTVIDKIIHKVFIEVNEKGTEAAAVTAIIGVRLSARLPPPPVPVVFRADHPFLYFIRDKSNSIVLFCGQINRF